ncbi:MAG: hypothetical protein WA021_03480 [Minisyncoccia bacterium]
MALEAAVQLLTTALMLLQLVSANPALPQSMRDTAQSVAQSAITEATKAIANPVTTTPSSWNPNQALPTTNASCTLDGVTVAHGQAKMFYLSRTGDTLYCAAHSEERTCQNGAFSGASAYQYTSCNPATTNTAPSSGVCSWGGSSINHNSSITAYQSASVSAGQQCASQTRTCSNGVLSGTYQYQSCASANAPSGGVSCTTPWGATVAGGASVTAYQNSVTSWDAAQNYCFSQTRTCVNGALSGTYQSQSCTVPLPSNAPSSAAPREAQLANALTSLESVLKQIAELLR